MAAATTPKNVWSDFAVLVASAGGKEWKVQINQDGVFRCSCPSYIFCKSMPRTCKHCRRCEEQRIAEGTGLPSNGIARPAAPVANPLLPEALKIFAAMCDAAQKKAKHNVTDHIGKDSCKLMVEALATKLAIFNPAAMPVIATETVVGVRRITFDD